MRKDRSLGCSVAGHNWAAILVSESTETASQIVPMGCALPDPPGCVPIQKSRCVLPMHHFGISIITCMHTQVPPEPSCRTASCKFCRTSRRYCSMCTHSSTFNLVHPVNGQLAKAFGKSGTHSREGHDVQVQRASHPVCSVPVRPQNHVLLPPNRASHCPVHSVRVFQAITNKHTTPPSQHTCKHISSKR
jgi:hypothetical protein